MQGTTVLLNSSKSIRAVLPRSAVLVLLIFASVPELAWCGALDGMFSRYDPGIPKLQALLFGAALICLYGALFLIGQGTTAARQALGGVLLLLGGAGALVNAVIFAIFDNSQVRSESCVAFIIVFVVLQILRSWYRQRKS